MRLTHEQKTEKFYSHGSEKRSLQEGGFLSFGYWTENTKDYYEAAENLFHYVIDKELPENHKKILNVACGYGSETFKIYEKLKPEKILAIDITGDHIKSAQEIAQKCDLEDKIIFKKMDACNLTCEDGSYSSIIGIEGPAHFNTRKKFIKDAYRILKKNGVLILTDIIVNNEEVEKNAFRKTLAKLCAKEWYMPHNNWTTTDEYKKILEEAGFEVETIKEIGNHVYLGFAHFNLKFSSFLNAIKVRGLFTGIGLTFISWLLGFLYKKKMLEYVYLRAVKK